MGRIKNIIVDKPGSRKDLVVGSDFDNFGVTRNYGLGGIADVINRASGKSIFIYKYTETLSELDTKNAVMSSVNGDLDSATVTSYRFSRVDDNGNDLSDIVTLYEANSDGIVLQITSVEDASKIAAYTIVSATTQTNYVEIEVLKYRDLTTAIFERNKEFSLSFDYVNNNLNVTNATNTSQLVNDGESGNPFISAYTHSQGLPSTVWTINHNLGRRPSVNVEDSAGSIMEGAVDHIDDNNLVITFNNGFSGEAHLN